MFVLKEPKDGQCFDGAVSCVADGNMFRLRGCAPFGILFGHGEVRVQPEPAEYMHLGPTALETLGKAMEDLGWNALQLPGTAVCPLKHAFK